MRKTAWLNIALKLGLLLALLAAAYYQVFHQRNIAEVLSKVENPLRPAALPAMLLVLLLVPLNWGLESEKWRLLIRSAQSLRAGKAFSAVLSGITLGLFTPNRIGEYGGRVLYLEPRHRWTAVSLSLVGSYAQILVTLSVGAICGRLFVHHHPDFLGGIPDWFFPGLFSGLAAAILLYAWIPTGLGVRLASILPKRVKPHVEQLHALTRTDLFGALFLSALRYAVFTAQYLVLLRVFGITLSAGEGITAIGTVFLLQSVLPSFAAVELLKRGNIALLVFGYSSATEISVLATSSTLWLINLILPAVLGYLLLLRRDFFRSETLPVPNENLTDNDVGRIDKRKSAESGHAL